MVNEENCQWNGEAQIAEINLVDVQNDLKIYVIIQNRHFGRYIVFYNKTLQFLYKVLLMQCQFYVSAISAMQIMFYWMSQVVIKIKVLKLGVKY